MTVWLWIAVAFLVVNVAALLLCLYATKQHAACLQAWWARLQDADDQAAFLVSHGPISQDPDVIRWGAIGDLCTRINQAGTVVMFLCALPTFVDLITG